MMARGFIRILGPDRIQTISDSDSAPPLLESLEYISYSSPRLQQNIHIFHRAKVVKDIEIKK